jgi:hypothetical protein
LFYFDLRWAVVNHFSVRLCVLFTINLVCFWLCVFVCSDHSRRRFGDGLSMGNSAKCGPSDKDTADVVSYMNSFENSSSSSDKV